MILALKSFWLTGTPPICAGDHAPKVQSYIGAAYREVWAGNMGMAISRATFEAAKRCHKAFCEFDDYNWLVYFARPKALPDSASFWGCTSAPDQRTTTFLFLI